MNYLYVKDWAVWQSYRKDRGTPPWIKVHRQLMTSAKWAILSDSEKGQLVSMWIAAADKKGKIPNDANLMRKICMLDDAPNLNKFIDLGYFVSDGCQTDDTATTKSQQSDAPETETETDKRQKRHTSNAMHFDAWWKEYPKKKEKKKALAIWKRRKLDTLADTIRADTIQRNETCADWKAGFICNPTTYLNGDRWEDEIETDRRPQNGTGKRETPVQRSERIEREELAKLGVHI